MLTLLANAKINLYLEIIGNRPDGFHELVMIMQSVALGRSHHANTAEVTDDSAVVRSSARCQRNHTNLAYRAVALLQKRFP